MTLPKLPVLEVGQHTARDIKAIVMFGLGIVILIALLGDASLFGSYFTRSFGVLLGYGIWFIPFAFFLMGLFYMYLPTFLPTYTRAIGITMTMIFILGIIHLSIPLDNSLEYAKNMDGGGLVGFTLVILFSSIIGKTASYVVFIAGMLIGIWITFNFSFRQIGNVIVWFLKVPPQEEVNVKIKEIKQEKEPKNTVSFQKHKVDDAKPTAEKKPEEEKVPELIIPTGPVGDYTFPDIDLLNEPRSGEADPGEIEENEQIIVKTLMDFSIIKAEELQVRAGESEVDAALRQYEMGHIVGPAVTQYSFKPPEGIKLSKITALQNDLALALAAESLRMEAPIPGKSKVGIELPNAKRSDVFLKEMLLSPEFNSLKGELMITIGKNVSGKPIVSDLTKMPHLLIAGATGAGKSVGINAILLSLLYTKSPDELKLILVDPKRVELTNYNKIPHLLTPVITEPEKTVTALRWAVAEMNRRYKVLEEGRVKNIVEYNKKFNDRTLPYIVIVVDELADLMMVAAKEVEASICRVAQLARAVGIHLIVATQRPSVDVITGLIKANIPTRVAYTVSSGIDSRTILDTVGAEKLLGLGDMLYLDGKSPKPIRLQGVYVSNNEIQKVIAEIRLTSQPEYQMDIVEERREIPQGIPGAGSMGVLSDDDDNNADALEREAIEVILETEKASASLLQRRLRVGYARAARLLDILEEKGFIGPSKGAKARDIYIDKNPYA